VTLPYDFSIALAKDSSENEMYSALIRNELTRMKEFGSLALNQSRTMSLIDQIEKSFRSVDFINEEEFIYE
jgi:anthranilate/para-aminobenzoate synthase component I